MKKCFKCNLKKELKDFYKHPEMSDGHVNKCKECNKKDVRENLKKNKEHYRAYDKERIRNNFNYIFIHRYAGMTGRTSGSYRNHGRIYKVTGKKICSKTDFMSWCYEKENLKRFQKIHRIWAKSGYNNSLSPSIDRIDGNQGYVISNIQWLHLGDNVRKH